MRCFNVTGICYPEKHYMVDLTERIRKIRAMIENGDYFCINRGRQYGKTTTLYALGEALKSSYMVVSIDFQYQMSEAKFQNEHIFSKAFAKAFIKRVQIQEMTERAKEYLAKMTQNFSEEEYELVELFEDLSEFCSISDKPVVLLMDEVDRASAYPVFLGFLAQLRGYFLNRGDVPTFQSVILASVYDIRNLKLKLRPEETHQYNSPWNIAADFNIDMEFSASEIYEMLIEYAADHEIKMNTCEMAELLKDYTDGHPFLVSRLCKIMDEKLISTSGDSFFENLETSWTKQGFLEAVKIVLQESNTLFDDMNKKLADFNKLKKMLYEMLYHGLMISFNQYEQEMNVGIMFDFLKNVNGKIVVANRIFETWLYNLFLSEEFMRTQIYTEGSKDKSRFTENGELDMKQVLERFTEHFTELYGDRDVRFLENEGRKYFLFYLKPIINGVGNYYIEAATRDERRTDVIVDYLGKQYIIAMKIWHGRAYHERGERQLAEYLDAYHLDTGYMLSFCFNQKKEIGVKKVVVGDKVLIEAVV